MIHETIAKVLDGKVEAVNAFDYRDAEVYTAAGKYRCKVAQKYIDGKPTGQWFWATSMKPSEWWAAGRSKEEAKKDADRFVESRW